MNAEKIGVGSIAHVVENLGQIKNLALDIGTLYLRIAELESNKFIKLSRNTVVIAYISTIFISVGIATGLFSILSITSGHSSDLAFIYFLSAAGGLFFLLGVACLISALLLGRKTLNSFSQTITILKELYESE